MGAPLFREKGYNVDEQGFLLDFNQWDEGFAALVASDLGMSEELSETHWAVIGFIRDSFTREGRCPLVYEACRAVGLSWSALKGLFPTGYHRGACLVAGIAGKDRLVNYYGERAPVRRAAEAKAASREKTYRVDIDGFLMSASEWDEEYAIRRAAEIGVPGGLSDKHWQIIRSLRESYRTTGVVPTVYECCESNGLELEELEKLFPEGYHRGAIKVSGLRVT